ncbi:MAG: phage portal protein [Promicromonosporaceae bacterium]|nr:phage portal protein [Promicromonosporaceae bacterium]
MATPPLFGVGQLHYATDGRDILENTPDGWEVDRQWLWWDGPAGGDGTGGPYGNPPPDARMFGPVMEGTSLTVYGFCESLVSDTLGSMPWKVYRGREQLDTPAWISDPQNLALDGRRNDLDLGIVRLSNVEFWSQAVRSYLGWGEAIIYTPRVRDAFGQPTGDIVAPVYLLHPKYVDVDEGRYYVKSDVVDEGIEYLDNRELIVVRNITRPGKERGLGILQAYAYDLAFAGKIRGYTDNMFQRGIPNGYLESDKPDLTDDQAIELKRSWMRANGSVRKSIAVLNATTHFHPLNLDPQIGNIIDMLRVASWEIALMFKIPPSQLGINMGDTGTYRNLETDNTVLQQRAYMLPARKFEAAIGAGLPLGTSLKLDFRQLLRADTKTRYESYAIALSSGFMSRDEVRELEDLPIQMSGEADNPPQTED